MEFTKINALSRRITDIRHKKTPKKLKFLNMEDAFYFNCFRTLRHVVGHHDDVLFHTIVCLILSNWKGIIVVI